MTEEVTLTIDEAIKHAEEVAEEKQLKAHNLKLCKDYGNPKSTITSGVVECETCAEEHRQLAEWLKELKRLREQEPVLDKIRAEIEEYKSRQLTLAIGVDDLEKGKQIALEYILAVLDKYKAEMESEE